VVQDIAKAGDTTGHCNDVAHAATNQRIRRDYAQKRGLPERGDLTALRQARRTTILHRCDVAFFRRRLHIQI
jgi:hypothetical protein